MTRTAYLTAAAAIALSVAPASTAVAQDAAGTNVTQRVDRIERELRAVQRRVFPGGAGVFQPEVQPGDTSTAPLAGSTPIADLTARVDALEAQLTRVTGEVEQTAFRQRELEAGIARLRTELSGRIDRLETAAAASAPPVEVAEPLTVRPTPSPTPAATPAPRPTTPSPTPAATPAPRPTTPRPTPAPTPTPTPRPTTGAATTAPATPAAIAARRARVAALEMPATGNAAEDAYLFGYRLWDAGLYPEAQAQLKKVVDTYPTHRRASFAANLLGRAYLDNGQPSLAVGVFYDNYRTRPRGERAPDSVYYMGQALTRLNRRSDACQTFDEFTRVYGATASESLKAQVATARSGAGC